jgi:hypothetical protein
MVENSLNWFFYGSKVRVEREFQRREMRGERRERNGTRGIY